VLAPCIFRRGAGNAAIGDSHLSGAEADKKEKYPAGVADSPPDIEQGC